jgi:hypothetical protein
VTRNDDAGDRFAGGKAAKNRSGSTPFIMMGIQ